MTSTRTIHGTRYGSQESGQEVKELTALRLPHDLVVRIRQRMRLESKTKTEVLIEAIERGAGAMTLIRRLRAYIPVEGQEGLRVREALMREAADELEQAWLYPEKPTEAMVRAGNAVDMRATGALTYVAEVYQAMRDAYIATPGRGR